MSDHRICFIGASGTGKTTLATALARHLNCPHFDSDDFFHEPTDPPYTKQRSPEDRARLLTEALAPHKQWTLSGGAGTWDPAPKIDYNLVVFLYLPSDVRLERIRRREAELFGARILAGGDMEHIHADFMAWTEGYDDGTAEGTNTLPAHREFLAKQTCDVLEFKESLTTNEQLRLVLSKLTNL